MYALEILKVAKAENEGWSTKKKIGVGAGALGGVGGSAGLITYLLRRGKGGSKAAKETLKNVAGVHKGRHRSWVGTPGSSRQKNVYEKRYRTRSGTAGKAPKDTYKYK